MSTPVTVIEKESELDRQEKRFARGAREMVDALQTIRDRELWRDGYASFDDYCDNRLMLGRVRQKHLLEYKLPPRLEQLNFFASPVEKPSTINVKEIIEKARQSGGIDAVAEVVKDRSRVIQERAAEMREREQREHEANVREQLRIALQRSEKMADQLPSMKRVTELVRQAREEFRVAV